MKKARDVIVGAVSARTKLLNVGHAHPRQVFFRPRYNVKLVYEHVLI